MVTHTTQHTGEDQRPDPGETKHQKPTTQTPPTQTGTTPPSPTPTTPPRMGTWHGPHPHDGNDSQTTGTKSDSKFYKEQTTNAKDSHTPWAQPPR